MSLIFYAVITVTREQLAPCSISRYVTMTYLGVINKGCVNALALHNLNGQLYCYEIIKNNAMLSTAVSNTFLVRHASNMANKAAIK
jgi:hypothetical protein